MADPRRAVSFVALVGCGFVAACGDDGGPPPTCLPDCTGDRTYDAVGYDLHARFDWDAGILTASEDITLAIGGSPIVELDAAVGVTAVHAGDRALAFVADPATSLLRVDLTPIAGTTPAAFTVDYQTGVTTALRVGGPRDDDPVTSRVVFTDSEPDRARLWLVANDVPSDRALWSVEITVAPDQDVIGNGARIADTTEGTDRRVRYALNKPIPTYLMAFAAGDLVHADRTTGRVPLAVWYRRGLAVDPDATLDVVADAMATFEAKIGPYPWDSYAVILAPGYGGGMENATITFNAESSGQGTVSFGLNAHELAHHWFGDWVTMHNYDDVWVKEGMATLLAAEADRARRDRTAAAARLFGYDFSFDPTEAIVDPALTGLDKYNTGPYERAAWLITQIRHEVGETAFWASLRSVLDQHAVGTITGAEFIAAFPLDPAVAAKALASLPAHESAQISVSATPGGGGTSVMFAATDPAETLLAPIDLTVVDAAGAATTQSLAPGAPVAMTVPAGGYLALDEADDHPDWEYSFALTGDFDAVLATTLPSAASTAAFASRSAATQERTLVRVGLPSGDPTEIMALYDALDSTYAQRTAVLDACGFVGSLTPAEADAMIAALAPALDAPALATSLSGYGRCGPGAGALFAAELGALADASTPATDGRLEYLLSFDYGAAASLATIGRVATTSPSLRLRDRAVQRLANQASGFAYVTPSAGEVPAWQAFFRDRLATTTSQNRLLAVWAGVYALADLTALPAVGGLLHTVSLSDFAQLRIVCQAAELTLSAPSDWAAFQAAAMPWDTLAADAAAALADPSACFANKRALEPRSTRRADGGERIDDRAER